MNLVLIIIFLIFLNFLLFFLLNKKKIKKFFNKTRIQEIDITDVQVIDYVVFKDISYKAPIISKPTTKPLANSKQIELKLNNGNNNINLNLNIDNKAYNKIKEVYEIQKTVDKNIPRLQIKNNCY